ncbi:MAG: S41 family peptidase [bacterium]|nr:S41 family peptidase [bacterium]
MDRELVRRAAGAALIAVLSFGAGIAVRGNDQGQNFLAHLPLIGDGLDATPDQAADLAAFWKAWNALSVNFVETHASSTLPSDKEKVWGAIAGLAASYKDPYTLFFPPEEAKKFEEDISGNFGGIGIEIDTKDGVLVVVAPLKGTPAEAAGVMAGDAIVAIDGKSTDGITTAEAVTKIRGPKGTTVVLSIMRAEKISDISVVRDTIQVPEIDDGLDATSGVYHIALYEFTATSAGLFDQAFERFKQSGSKLLVLDLRGNPGGYLESSVEIASHFLPTGSAVVTEDYQGKHDNEVHQSYGYNDVPRGTKIVVLINQGSASASEILAGALQDSAGATLIGMNSFGKGSVQQLITLDEGSLKVTVARWLTPGGKNISDGGLTPDIKIDRTAEDFAAKRDPQMSRAIQFLTTGK